MFSPTLPKAKQRLYALVVVAMVVVVVEVEYVIRRPHVLGLDAG